MKSLLSTAFLTTFLAALLPALPFTAFAGQAETAAETRLKAAVDQVVTIVKGAHDRPSLIREVKAPLETILNFGVMTKRAIGPGWKQFTPAQQQEATSLFTTLILRTYTAKFTPGEFPTVDFKAGSETAPGRVEITTTSTYKASHYEVIYRLENQGGDWTITDVVIEGVSLVADYRAQFDGEFQKGGAEAVLRSLRNAVVQSK